MDKQLLTKWIEINKNENNFRVTLNQLERISDLHKIMNIAHLAFHTATINLLHISPEESCRLLEYIISRVDVDWIYSLEEIYNEGKDFVSEEDRINYYTNLFGKYYLVECMVAIENFDLIKKNYKLLDTIVIDTPVKNEKINELAEILYYGKPSEELKELVDSLKGTIKLPPLNEK